MLLCVLGFVNIYTQFTLFQKSEIFKRQATKENYAEKNSLHRVSSQF